MKINELAARMLQSLAPNLSLEEISQKCEKLTGFSVCQPCNLLRFSPPEGEEICEKCKDPMFCIDEDGMRELDEELAR